MENSMRLKDQLSEQELVGTSGGLEIQGGQCT